ncbi:MAG: hypothetical protein ACTSQP_15890 [Promethearchaeota archaeon]
MNGNEMKYLIQKYIFIIYLILVVIIFYILLISIENIISFLIVLLQIVPLILSALIIYFYYNQIKIYFLFNKILEALGADEEWEKIENLFNNIKEHPIKLDFKWIYRLNYLIFVMIIISFIINTIYNQNNLFFIIPSIFIAYLFIIYWTNRIPEKKTILLLKKWFISEVNNLIKDFEFLKSYKLKETLDYFRIIDENIAQLLENLNNFNNLLIFSKEIINLSSFNIFIVNNINLIRSIISEIYLIRGNLINTYSIILKIRENKIIQLRKLDEIQKNEFEKKRLEIINQKELKFKNIINSAQKEMDIIKDKILEFKEELNKEYENYLNSTNELTEKMQKLFQNNELELEQKKEEFNIFLKEKMKNSEQLVNQFYSSYFKCFEELDNRLKEHYNKLQSKLTQLFFERFYAELTKNVDYTSFDHEFIRNFIFIADLFFIDIIQENDKDKKEYILNKLCQIHKNLII